MAINCNDNNRSPQDGTAQPGCVGENKQQSAAFGKLQENTENITNMS